MLRKSRPLWQLLLLSSSSDPPNLTCDECFQIVEYLADLRQRAGLDWSAVALLVDRHLASCNHCNDYFHARLAQMEALVDDDAG